MVNHRQTIQFGGSRLDGFLYADRRFFVTVEAGIGINGAGQQIALFLQGFEQRNMFIHQRHARARLAQGFTLLVGLKQSVRKAFFLRNGLLVLHAIFEVLNVLAGMPGLQYLMPLGHEFVVG